MSDVIDMEAAVPDEQTEEGGEQEVEELEPEHQSDDGAPIDEATQQPLPKRKKGERSALRKIEWGCFTIARKRVSDVESAQTLFQDGMISESDYIARIERAGKQQQTMEKVAARKKAQLC